MATIAPARDDPEAWEVRGAARLASRDFWACVDRLPRTQRRAREIATRWEYAAALAYWHRREVFRDAEELGFELITGLPTQTCSRRQWLEFTDACEHATALMGRQLRASGETDAVRRAGKAFNLARTRLDDDAALRAAAREFAGPPTQTRSGRTQQFPKKRSVFVDQTELRWRMSIDATSLRFATIFASDASSREAERRYLPWLQRMLDALRQPMTTVELDVIAAQWRTYRAEFLDNHTWADVIIVEAIERKPTTWWWRLWHIDEPTPPR